VAAITPDQLRLARETAGFTQQQAAERLGVSQAYLALMETGRRRVTEEVGLKMMDLYHLGPTVLPLRFGALESWDSARLAKALANLGYPGFRNLLGGPRDNPAVVLLAALSRPDVEVRVLEGLPWLVVEYYDLDWEWLTREVKVRDAQNRLGFIVTLGRRIAGKQGGGAAQSKLREVEELLDRARLAREDSLCQGSLSAAEHRWLRRARPADARHWNLLTDLDAEHLPYAA
jgi:transcriptional regulator with XRE-family HTH domain